MRDPAAPRRYNPAVTGPNVPELADCGAGDLICLLVNPGDYFCGRAAPVWEQSQRR